MKIRMFAASAVIACFGLAACGHTAGERTLSGAAIGAGAGAAIGAATGTAATGAAIGAGVGALAGYATTPHDEGYRERYRSHYNRDYPRECDYDRRWWDEHGGPPAYHEECEY